MGDCFIVRRGGATVKKPPALSPFEPADVTIIESANGSATFSVSPIALAGNDILPCTYQWYVDNVAVSGATSETYTKTGLTSAATYNVYCDVTNEAGTTRSRIAKLVVANSKPIYTYNGSHELIKDHTYSWRIKFKSSGTLRFIDFGFGGGRVDIFCVGGGGGGSAYQYQNGSGAGGGGGYTTTLKDVTLALNTDYEVFVGAGGAPELTSVGGDGGRSYIAGIDGASANGGYGAGRGVNGNKPNRYYGGDGGSGGGAAGSGTDGTSGAGGSNGGNGGDGINGTDGSNQGVGGTGQGTTTREFSETSGALYSGGGAGARVYYVNSQNGGNGGGGGVRSGIGDSGDVNTGGGGGGSGANNSNAEDAGYGGSGIVIIRNKR